MTRDLVSRERALLAEYDALRAVAPNPRDFPSWAAFYSAQLHHEEAVAALGAKLEAIRVEAWS